MPSRASSLPQNTPPPPPRILPRAHRAPQIIPPVNFAENILRVKSGACRANRPVKKIFDSFLQPLQLAFYE